MGLLAKIQEFIHEEAMQTIERSGPKLDDQRIALKPLGLDFDSHSQLNDAGIKAAISTFDPRPILGKIAGPHDRDKKISFSSKEIELIQELSRHFKNVSRYPRADGEMDIYFNGMEKLRRLAGFGIETKSDLKIKNFEPLKKDDALRTTKAACKIFDKKKRNRKIQLTIFAAFAGGAGGFLYATGAFSAEKDEFLCRSFTLKSKIAVLNYDQEIPPPTPPREPYIKAIPPRTRSRNCNPM